MTMGERIRARRKAMRLSQTQLAEQVGLTRNTVGNIETGTFQTKLVTLEHIAAALHTTVGDLVDGTPRTMPARIGRQWCKGCGEAT